MTQEEKQLLLLDLCARLPYGVKVRTNRGPEKIEGLAPFCHNEIKIALNLDWSLSISYFTPYLRPLSSMTEEEDNERKQLGILCAIKRNGSLERIFDGFGNESVDTQLKALDWLNAHHFDYRGLIEKGLALRAPKGMYKMN